MIRIDDTAIKYSRNYVRDTVFLLPLSRACFKNDVDYVKTIITERNVNINLLDNRGYAPLHYAAEAGSLKVLKLLLEQPSIDLDIISRHNSETPLHRAIGSRKMEAIKILQEAGADDCFDETLFLLLFCKGRMDIKTCLKMGKKLLETEPENHYKITKVMILTIQLYQRIIRRSNGKDWLTFFHMFMYYNADVNTCYDDYDNVFSLALKCTCHEICNIMLPFVSDFNMIIHYDQTIFLYAIECKSKDVFYMIEHGADVNFNDGNKSCLEVSMMHSVELFLYILTHCDDKTILSEPDFFHKFLCLNVFGGKGFVRCVNAMFEHRCAVEIFSDVNRTHEIHLNFFHAIKYLNISVDDQVKMLYALLTFNNELMLCELHQIYEIFGFDDRFEAYLRVTVDVKNNLKTFCFDESMHRFMCLCGPNMFIPKIIGVPTLTELSRNCIRRNIRHDLIYNGDNIYFKYYNHLMQLKLPPKILNVLSLREL